MATVEQPTLSFKTALQKHMGDITEATSNFILSLLLHHTAFSNIEQVQWFAESRKTYFA